MAGNYLGTKKRSLLYIEGKKIITIYREQNVDFKMVNISNEDYFKDIYKFDVTCFRYLL